MALLLKNSDIDISVNKNVRHVLLHVIFNHGSGSKTKLHGGVSAHDAVGHWVNPFMVDPLRYLSLQPLH